MALTKAKITINTPSPTTLDCYFNPENYTIARSISWSGSDPSSKGSSDATSQVKFENVPKHIFSGIGQTTMSLKLLFDTSLNGQTDVRTKYTDKLWKTARVVAGGKDPKPPPTVVFTWGRTWSFEAVVTNISQTFLLFKEDGTPIRTEVTLSLQQIKDQGSFAKQNPTSGGEPGQVHVVREGDRLDLLAAQYYSKPILWRFIAEHNDIDNPRVLEPGTRLIIPRLP